MRSLFKLFGGFSFVKRVADEVGVDRRVFGTALTETGFNYATLRNINESLIEGGYTEQDALQECAQMCLKPALSGLLILEKKFPGQPEIEEAFESVQKYAQSIDITEVSNQ
ncbi:hypothetical protein [Pseudovibrio sp. POLY-S9]|uniref:hypothetical protein n=1 Tax=Pseudovibrio sp. POLY-S9 TaxID=1576596 RepID=UPI0007090093|nr:hypothetical protein [Pseudovibrio sp. POLY-S9]